MITREQLEDLRVGDVVEIRDEQYPDVVTRGPIREISVLGPVIGSYDLQMADGSARCPGTYTLTVISRAPRPFYVNCDRTEPVPGDVIRDADGEIWLRDSFTTWHSPDSTCEVGHQETGLEHPLRLLVDGTTGEVATS